MALAVAALAAGAKNVDPAYAATADTLLKVFFLDPETKMNPEVKYAQVNMGDCPMKGDKTFVVAVRGSAWEQRMTRLADVRYRPATLSLCPRLCLSSLPLPLWMASRPGSSSRSSGWRPASRAPPPVRVATTLPCGTTPS